MRKIPSLFLPAAIALCAFSAEDVTQATPQRLGPAVGVSSTPFAAGLRMPFTGYRSLDLMLRVPQFIKNESGGSGLEIGAMAGFNIPLRLEENLGMFVRPQIELSYRTEGIEVGNDNYDRSELRLRPGAFLGVEVFLEEIGMPNANITLGFTAGLDIGFINVDDDLGGSSNTEYRIPAATYPFGATVGLWWYF